MTEQAVSWSYWITAIRMARYPTHFEYIASDSYTYTRTLLHRMRPSFHSYSSAKRMKPLWEREKKIKTMSDLYIYRLNQRGHSVRWLWGSFTVLIVLSVNRKGLRKVREFCWIFETWGNRVPFTWNLYRMFYIFCAK